MISYVLTLLILCLMPTWVWALAFPTAEGFGANTSGGRGGTVYHVTNTNPSGTGSLRDCVEDTLGVGARTCIFRVGGVIDLGASCPPNTGNWIRVEDPNLTIAGQTAPGDGIMLQRGDFQIRESNVIVRHFRTAFGYHCGLNQEGDAVSISPGPQDIIVDHSSIFWGFDSDVEIWGGSQRITFQWNIIAESLHCLGNPADPCTSRAMLLGAGTQQNTVHHNLFVHHFQRDPHWKSGSGEWINNYFFNTRGCQFKNETGVIQLDFVKNYYEIFTTPPGSQKHCLLNNNTGPTTGGTVYLLGNIDTRDRPTDTGAEDAIINYSGTPGTFLSITTSRHFSAIPSEESAINARASVLARAGPKAHPFIAHENRVLNEISAVTGPGGSGTNTYVFLPSDVGGFPALSSGTPYPDVDVDGIDDDWETLCNSYFSGSTTGGLSSSDGTDGADILDWTSPTGPQAALEGYSKLEVFLNELASDYDSVPGSFSGDGLNTCGGLVTPASDPTPPSTPTMNAPTVVDHQQIDLSWSAATDAQSGISGYNLYWCSDATKISTCTPANLIQPGNVTSYQHTSLQPDTQYGYQVSASNGGSPPLEGDKSTPVQYATTDAAPAPDYTSDLLSHWTCDNTPNDVQVANNGTWVGTPAYAAGKLNSACSFNGSTQAINAGSNTSLDAITTGTLAFWMRPDVSTSTSARSLINKATIGASSDDFYLDITPSGHPTNPNSLRFLTESPASDTIYGGGEAIPSGQWAHFTVVWDATIKRIYINGQPGPFIAAAGEMTDATADLCFGAFACTQDWFSGRIDDIRLYSGRVLSAADIEALFNTYSVGDTEAPCQAEGGAPPNPSASALDHETITLEWDPCTDNGTVALYRIQRCEGPGCATFADHDTALGTFYVDSDLNANTTYRYQIRAEDTIPNVSAYSTPVEATTDEAPLFVMIPPGTSTPTDTAASTIAFPPGTGAPTDTAATSPALPPGTNTPSDTAGTTVAIPPGTGVPTSP